MFITIPRLFIVLDWQEMFIEKYSIKVRFDICVAIVVRLRRIVSRCSYLFTSFLELTINKPNDDRLNNFMALSIIHQSALNVFFTKIKLIDKIKVIGTGSIGYVQYDWYFSLYCLFFCWDVAFVIGCFALLSSVSFQILSSPSWTCFRGLSICSLLEPGNRLLDGNHLE